MMTMQVGEKNGLIFIDWDGTLSHGRFWSSLATDTYQAIQKKLFENNKALVIEWMLGRRDTEQICRWLASETNLDEKTLQDSLLESCGNMALTSRLRGLLAQIRQTHYLVLVTDNMDCFTKATVPDNSLEDVFDCLINSADLRRLKCDDQGLTFTDAMARFGILPSNSLLIDDSAKTCALFQKLGGSVFQTSGVINTEKLLRSLADGGTSLQDIRSEMPTYTHQVAALN